MPNGIVDIHRLAKLIAVSSAFGVFVALYHQTVNGAFVVSELSVSVFVTCVAAIWIKRRTAVPPNALAFVLPGLMMIPFLFETISQSAFAFGLPLEATTLCAIRNLIFVVFVFPKSDRCERIAVAASLLAMLSICLMANRTASSVFVLVHCVLCMRWLIGSHWRQLQVKAPNDSQRYIPRSARIGVVVVTTLIATIASFFYSNAETTSAIAGFMPSSGGTEESDPFAFSGVGDGDQLVRGTEDAKTFGPVESDIFLESKMPSIYDVFNDLYNEPKELPKETARAIPLAPQDVVSNHEKLAKNEVAGREFSAIRQKTKNNKRPKNNLTSDALFYISGQVPLHLKQNVYNHWDGTALSFRGKPKTPNLLLVSARQKAWVACDFSLSPRISPDAEENTIRIARIKTERVPSPSNLKAVRVDRIHTARFFRWSQDGVVKVASNNIPSMTILHTLSELPRREQIEQGFKISNVAGPDSQLDKRVAKLLREWTSTAMNDWERVVGIADGIRTSCTLDADAAMEATHDDAVAEFLLEKKRGPDYMFAIATARLLREIGCQVRVVSGFYADPENYDRLSRQTAVLAKDAHFWVEVQTSDVDWVTVDPSPGYQVRYARVPVQERLVRYAKNVMMVLRTHRFSILCCLLTALASVIWKNRVYAFVLGWWWRLPIPRTDRSLVRSSLALLEAQARVQGLTRSPGTTVESWLEQSLQSQTDRSVSSFVFDFQRLVQWSLYSPAKCPPESLDVRQVCRNLIDFTNCRSVESTETKKRGV